MSKVAILIDGGYFLKRLPQVRKDVDAKNAKSVVNSIYQLVHSHLEKLNETHCVKNKFQLLYRTFYYDAKPYIYKMQRPVSGQAINYAKSEQAAFRNELFAQLRKSRNYAVRLGDVIKDNDTSWVLKPDAQKKLLRRKTTVEELVDTDFIPALRQKGVDIRIGLDIATITLKRQANIIVLVTGDSDFVSAAKLARREGMQVILDPLWQNVHADLSEHIDQLQSGFY